MSFCDVLFVGHAYSGANLYSYLQKTITMPQNYCDILPPFYPEPNDHVLHYIDGNKKSIEAATLRKLVECITADGFSQENALVLVQTHLNIIDSKTLMQTLQS